MNLENSALIGIVAGVINTAGLVPYIRDIFRHKTKPERAMWWIYCALFTLLFAAQAKAGADWLLFVTASYVLSSTLIAILSLRYGYGSFHKRDFVSITIATIGLILWLITDRPLVAILMVIIVDVAGFWLTLVKTWHAPHTETLISWQLAFLAAFLSIFSITTWSLDVVIYPLYAVSGNALIVWLIMHRRKKVLKDPSDF